MRHPKHGKKGWLSAFSRPRRFIRHNNRAMTYAQTPPTAALGAGFVNVTVGKGGTAAGFDYATVTAADVASQGGADTAGGWYISIDSSYTDSTTADNVIQQQNNTWLFPNKRVPLNGTLTINNAGLNLKGQLHTLRIEGGAFNKIFIDASVGAGQGSNHNISDITFVGTYINDAGSPDFGIEFKNGGSNNYIQQTEFVACRFDDYQNSNGTGFLTWQGTANSGFGGMVFTGCTYSGLATTGSQTMVLIPAGSTMGTVLSWDGSAVLGINGATPNTIVGINSLSAAGAGTVRIGQIVFTSGSYFEIHDPGGGGNVTTAVVFPPTSDTAQCKMNIVFDNNNFNVSSSAAFTFGNVTNTYWKAHAANGISSITINLGQTQASAVVIGNLGTLSADYVPQVFDPTSQLGAGKYQANNLPYVTVGPDEYGWAFGPLVNPTSTTSGIQEALNYVSAAGGGTVYISPVTLLGAAAGAYTVTTTITVPTNCCLKSDMWGGGEFGPHLNAPGSYISPSGTGFSVFGGSTNGTVLYIGSNTVTTVSNAGIEGIAILSAIASANLSNVVQMSGARNCFVRRCCIASTATNVNAIQHDGWGSPAVTPTVGNGEHCKFENSYFAGDNAIQIGISGEFGKPNDSVWEDIDFDGYLSGLTTGSSPTISAGHQGLLLVEGGQIQFRNMYCRTQPTGSGVQVKISGGNSQWYGGEQDTTSSGSNMWSMGGGNMYMFGGSWTAGKIVQSGGTLAAIGFKFTGTCTLTLSGSAVFTADASTIFSGLTLAGSAGTAVLPNVSPANGTGNYTSWFGSFTFTGTLVFNNGGGATTQYVLNKSAAATASTTLVMAGFALSVTPLLTGKLRITFTGVAQTATGTAAVGILPAYGTPSGSAPSNGAAPTGTTVGTQLTVTMAGTAKNSYTGRTIIISGLTVGTSYWIDLQYNTTVGADSATLASFDCIIEEIPY